ncbi:winged helix-turn-helix transcriptional regulator [Paenibacillus sp. IHB B 3084]|uniref:winged helix-turn-helix transcriptional regulator n=1 Tax=Paenibacillus sp. IHB B 3084 TaxID=867076 RepID=UPI0016710F9D
MNGRYIQKYPPKVCYKITEYGMTLGSIFEVLHEWEKERNNQSNYRQRLVLLPTF